MTWGSYYWPFFLTLTFCLFIVPETIALLANSANTLSVYAWKMLDVTRALEFSQHGAAWWASFIMWLVFVVIITVHIWFMSV